jgi:colanic acid biosynthesis glycosyl transferase WcaI
VRVLILNQCYAPEEVSGAVLATELASDLAKGGHQVAVLTAAPNYPYGRVFRGYRNRFLSREWLDGVEVVRTWSYLSPQKTFWRRILNFGSQAATAFYGGLFSHKPDIVLVFSPPLPLAVTAWTLAAVWRIPWVLQLEDIYPDAAIQAGVLSNRLAIRSFFAVESFLYRRATRISVISETFREIVKSKGIEPDKLTLIPLWADPESVRPLSKENEFRDRHGLAGKFVLIYAGNHGVTSCLEAVVGAAERLQDDADIRFVFVGEGVKKIALQETAREKGLRNLLFLPYEPRQDYPVMLAAADLSVVTLNQESSATSLPSKAFNIMASGRPILAICPENSELAKLIREAECGVSVPKSDPGRIADTVRELKNDMSRLHSWGSNGRLQLENKFSRARCVRLFEEMLQDLSRAPHGTPTHVRGTAGGNR